MNNYVNPKPSQAKPSQAKPKLASKSRRFWGALRSFATRLIPENSALFRLLYIQHLKISINNRKRLRQTADKLSLNVMVTDACNLNCRGCVTFSPLVKNADMLDIASYRKDIAQLSDLFGGEAKRLELFGGEPLMHPDLVDIMSITRQAFPNGELFLITNGVLLHKMDEDFWKSCHRNDFLVRITSYPIKLNYERIMALAEEHGVKVAHFGGTELYFKERNYFSKYAVDPAGKNDVNRSFELCPLYLCQVMRGGKIYRCNAPCFVGAFNDYFDQKLEVSEKDYVDIHKVNSKEEIFDFLAKPVPFCRYCDMDKWEFGLPWERSKKQIDEWV